MSAQDCKSRLRILEGDITLQEVDAIVNAANASLMGGGGVDGAIHRAAGPELLEECRKLGGCPTGEARLTLGFNLPAKYVIHTVGPVWKDGRSGEAQLLENCYRNSLALTTPNGIQSVAFPSISTGAYRFPLDQAANIALRTTAEFLEKNSHLIEARMVCFGKEALDCYQKTYRRLFG